MTDEAPPPPPTGVYFATRRHDTLRVWEWVEVMLRDGTTQHEQMTVQWVTELGPIAKIVLDKIMPDGETHLLRDINEAIARHTSSVAGGKK